MSLDHPYCCPSYMRNHDGESGSVLTQQLRLLSEHIERTKDLHVEILKEIWPDKLPGLGFSESEHIILAVQMDCSN